MLTNHEHLVNLLLIFLKDALFRLYNICVCQSLYQFVYLSSVLYSILHFNLALSEAFPHNIETLISKVVEESTNAGDKNSCKQCLVCTMFSQPFQFVFQYHWTKKSLRLYSHL